MVLHILIFILNEPLISIIKFQQRACILKAPEGVPEYPNFPLASAVISSISGLEKLSLLNVSLLFVVLLPEAVD